MSEFDEIRPYRDDEVDEVIGRLGLDAEFIEFITRYRFPRAMQLIPRLIRPLSSHLLRRRLGKVHSIVDFQSEVYRYVQRIVKHTITKYVDEGVDKLCDNRPHLLMSNHRDIAADSALLNYSLYQKGQDTVEIALGDNLLQKDFASDIMRLNKSFVVKRSEQGMKKIYAALMNTSRYIRHSLEAGNSVWIAQSEGRAKNGIDRTEPAIIKMLTLAYRKEGRSFGEIISVMNLIPVSISYEYDPCDQLKAKELYYVDSEGGYSKPPGEDLLSLAKGLGEYKGTVYLKIGEALSGDYQTAEEAAEEIDRQIIGMYELQPSHFAALSMLEEQPFCDLWNELKGRYESKRSSGEVEFSARLAECPAEQQLFFKKIYANPVVSKHVMGLLSS